MNKIFKSVNSKYASSTGTVTGDITQYHQCGVGVPKNRGESGRKFGLRFTVQEMLDFIGEKKYTATFFTKFYNMKKTSTEINLLCNFSLTSINDIKDNFSSSNYTIIVKQEILEQYISTDITELLKETLSLAVTNDETYFSLWGGTNYISDTSSAEALMYGTETDFYPYIEINLENIPITSITLTPSSLTLTEGETATLTAIVSPSDATNQTLSWSSTNSSVAEVDSNGNVIAVSAGSAIITCMATDGSGVSASCNVIVNSSQILITSITLNKTTSYLYIGESETLIATILPSNATNQNLFWYSSDSNIASVDQNGTVTAIREGSVTIACAAEDGSGKSAICDISVQTEEITISPTSVALEVGDTTLISVKLDMSSLSSKEIVWHFDSTYLEKVSESSSDTIYSIVLKALNTIDSTIVTCSVESLSGTISVQCEIKITSSVINVTGISISPSSSTLKLNESQTFIVTIEPSNASNPSFSWRIDETDGEEYLSLSDNTFTVIKEPTDNDKTFTINAITEESSFWSNDAIITIPKAEVKKQVYIYVGGEYKPAKAYVYNGGWQECSSVWIYNGDWKQTTAT